MLIFKYQFLQYAYISGILIALIIPILGSFLILRKQSYLADTISHVSLTGISFAALISSAINPLYFGIVFAVIGAVIIEYIRSKFKGFQELSLLVVMSFSIALAITFASISNTYSNLSSYLFGSINTITFSELIILAISFIIVVIYVKFNYYNLIGLCIDEEYLKIRRGNINVLKYTFIIAVSLVIALSIKIIGALLVGALMIIPTTIAMRKTSSLKQTQIMAIVIALVGTIIGLILSYYFNMPSGAAIILVLGIEYILAKFFNLKIAMATLLIFITGCSNTSNADVVVSSYAIEYITTNIVKDKLVVENILPNNVDPHDYSPTQSQVMMANDAKLVLYVDEHFDPSLSKIEGSISVYEEIDNSLENAHFWISPKQMISASKIVYRELVSKFPQYEKEFKTEYDKLILKLEELNRSYQSGLENQRLNQFIINHDSFAHLIDYNIETIPLSSDDHSDEASQKELVEIMNIIDENKIEYIATEKGIACDLCKVLEEEKQVETIELNSLETNKIDYFSAMEENLKQLQTLLK